MSMPVADSLLLLVTLIWGTTFVIVKNAVAEMSPYLFIASRFGLALVVLLPLAFRQLKSMDRAAWRSGVLTGFFLFGGFVTQTLALQYSLASTTAFLTGLSVVIVPLLAGLVLKRPIEGSALGGAVLATAGLGLLSLAGSLVPTVGDLLGLACALFFALHILTVDRYARQIPVLAFTTLQVGTAFLLSALAAGIDRAPVEWNPSLLAAVAATGVLATALVFFLQTTAQRHTSPTHTALIFTMEPVFAAFFAWWWAGETLTGQGWLGAGLILAGMLLAEVGPRLKNLRQGTARGQRAS